MATPRTAPTGSTRKTSTRKSATSVTFDIAAAEAESLASDERPEPFTVRLPNGGEKVTFKDPQDMGVIEFAALDERDVVGSFRSLLSEEDFEKFVDAKVTVRGNNLMMAAFREHYGVIAQGN